LSKERVSRYPEHDAGQSQDALLSPVRARIIAVMRDNPNITQKRMSEELGLGHTAVADNIAWLRDNGYVVREGSRKAGWWRVL
jgi:predicted HTH transcriptional regulator